MTTPATRLFERQLHAARSAGAIDLQILESLVIGAYGEFDDDRRRTDAATHLMAEELEQANVALGDTVSSLQAQNMRFAMALDTMTDGLALYDANGKLIVANRRMQEILAPSGVTAEPCSIFADTIRANVADEAAVQRLLDAFEARVEARLDCAFPAERQVSITIRPMPDEGHLVCCADVTESSRAAARIAFLAYHDTLTALPNRALLRERLDTALQAGQCAVLCLDLDGFKSVNDTLGHAVGDGLLCAVTARLHGLVRDGETVSRLGGDEFAVVIRGDAEAADATAARMVDAIAASFEIEGHRLNTGTSIGIAIAPDHGTTVDELLRNADIALYAAKSEGRGCFRTYNLTMASTAQSRRMMEQELRIALAAGQFELHYQPQLRMADNRVASFEALLRWRHPVHGLVSPATFIPVAEDSGLIVKIGEWVLHEACREAARWPREVGIAVNVSAVQMSSSNLFAFIAHTLHAAKLDPARLEIEITETAMVKNWPATSSTMHRLRALGVRIAMDDFGSGFSSLNYLQSFPFDRIKIDRTFVAIMDTDPKAAAIVHALTELANTLRIAVTAEGVETQSQLQALTESRCSTVQGFLYSRAVPPAQITSVLATFGIAGTAPPASLPPLGANRSRDTGTDWAAMMASPAI